MGAGDILLLHTDGLTEHANGGEAYFPGRLENVLRKVKDRSAREIFAAIQDDLVQFAKPQDDVSFVVVKKLI
jgi:sigma-B regulation protein RsbU (phosphoserine phosphatase)